MSDDTDRQARLTQIARIAVAMESQTGCPAPMMIAQWAVESRWGAQPAGHANYFGVKKNSRDPESCTELTEEVVNGKQVAEELQFADYDSLDADFHGNDHRFQLKAINVFILGDHHRSEATLAF